MHLKHSEERLHELETFTYRGYECSISYNGIRPHFTVNGESAESFFEDFEVTPETVGSGLSWDDALMTAIDQHEGDAIDSDSYVVPSERQRLRHFSSRYFDFMAASLESFHRAQAVIETVDASWSEIRNRVRQESQRLRKNEEAFGLQSRDEAYDTVGLELVEEYNSRQTE